MSRAGVPSSEDLADIETRADLARALTALRTQAGLSVRTLARRLEVPTATVGDYCSGRHLPGLSQLATFSALLDACGVPEVEHAGWIDALTRVRSASDRRLARVPAPYRGLERFEVGDAGLYFGREAVIEQLLERLRALRDQPPAAGDSAAALIVLGPSGSGKSSLLRAGIAARVRAGALDTPRAPWSAVVMLPGEAPAPALREATRELDGQPGVLVVDQLEELFGIEEAARGRFLDELAAWGGPERVVVASLRADFYAAALAEPRLLAALRDGQVLLAPMTVPELRRAILEPARHAGARVEPGLADVLLAELGTGPQAPAAQRSAALPLLSHALLATWEQARANELTVEDYRAGGGVRGAVRQSAEQLYLGLEEAERELARRIFCRLVRVTDDNPPVRRRAARTELEELDGPGADSAGGSADSAASRVLERFVGARLLTADGATIELSHEALITAWPRLTGWIEDDRIGLRLQHQLTDAASAWTAGDRDPALLWRGSRLEAAVERGEDLERRAPLTRAERAFLDAGRAVTEAERAAARRRTRRMQQLLGVLATVTVAAAVLAVLAVRAQDLAENARNDALSRQVAVESDALVRTDPGLAMQLALAARRVAVTRQATSTLLDSSAFEMPTRILGADGPTEQALTADGRELALGDSAPDEVTVYRLGGGPPARIAFLSPHVPGQALYALALSPNGRLLAAGGTGRQVTLWSLAHPAHPVRLATLRGFGSTVYGVAFAPDGRRLAVADFDGTVRQWSLADPAHPVAAGVLAVPAHASVNAVAYSPDGRTLAAVSSAGAIVLWRSAGSTGPFAVRTLSGNWLTSIAFSPNGSVIAVGSQEALVSLWRVAPGLPAAHAPLHGFTNWVNSVAFSPDGRYLVAGSSDSTARVWSTAGYRELATFTHPAQVTGVAFLPGHRSLVTVDEDGTARIWSFPPPSTVREPAGIYSVDYTANGDELAAVSGGPGGDVDLWDTRDPWRPTHIGAVRLGPSFGPAWGVGALSPDGRLLAVGDQAGKVRLVALGDPRRPHVVGPMLSGAEGGIEQLVFRPGMRELAVGDGSGRIERWDIADPSRPVALPTLDPHGGPGQALGVAYSPDGRLLAVAMSDGSVRIWSDADPHRPRALAVLRGFSGAATTLAFTPEGRTLIAGGADDTIRLWNVADPAHPRLLGRPLTGPTSEVYDVAVNPGGTLLAAATTSGDVLLYTIADPGRPVELADLTAATGTLYDVTFSPDGSTLAASGADQRVTFWDVNPGQVATRICRLAGAPLTRREWTASIQGAAYHPPCRAAG